MINERALMFIHLCLLLIYLPLSCILQADAQCVQTTPLSVTRQPVLQSKTSAASTCHNVINRDNITTQLFANEANEQDDETEAFFHNYGQGYRHSNHNPDNSLTCCMHRLNTFPTNIRFIILQIWIPHLSVIWLFLLKLNWEPAPLLTQVTFALSGTDWTNLN